jgi:hypothetical protein
MPGHSTPDFAQFTLGRAEARPGGFIRDYAETNPSAAGTRVT